MLPQKNNMEDSHKVKTIRKISPRITIVYVISFVFFVIQALSRLTATSITALAETRYEAEGLAECVMEVDSRRVLFERNADTRLPMASTTKIVTAITTIERCGEMKRLVNIPDEAIGVEGSSVYLNKENSYTVEDLLYGLMLRSGNDCAVALAHYIAGGIDEFSIYMNRMAEKAGALNSQFVNPHGLPQENHYTTARDLTNITCYAMNNKLFKQIVSTKYYQNKGWSNKNKMLSRYEGACGVKTGYTKQAGRCLVSAAQKNGMTLVCTLLNCPTTYERTTRLFDDIFESYQNYRLLQEGQLFEFSNNGVQAVGMIKENFCYPLLKEELEYIEISTTPANFNKKSDENGEIIGQIKITLSKRLIFLGNLYKL